MCFLFVCLFVCFFFSLFVSFFVCWNLLLQTNLYFIYVVDSELDLYYVQQFGRQRHRVPASSPVPVSFDVHDDLNELPCVSISVWSPSKYSADTVKISFPSFFLEFYTNYKQYLNIHLRSCSFCFWNNHQCLGEAMIPLRVLPTTKVNTTRWYELRTRFGRNCGHVLCKAYLLPLPGAGEALVRNVKPLGLNPLTSVSESEAHSKGLMRSSRWEDQHRTKQSICKRKNRTREQNTYKRKIEQKNKTKYIQKKK